MSVLILKEFRDKHSMSREDQADLLNISIDTLNNWEYRTKSVPSSKLKNIEYVFSMYKENNYIHSNMYDNQPKIDLKECADYIAENFKDAKKVSKLFDLTVQNDNRDYLITYLTSKGFIVKE